jgi:hypothetical protein
MPNLGELVGRVVEVVGSQIGSTSLRLGGAPTLAILGAILILLSFVARPPTRWTTRDLGRLAGIGRAMALAAESGATAAFSLGTAGASRSSAAVDRIQTLAALPILDHVARAAARGGVPLRVTTNDIVAAHLAEAVLAEAHQATDTQERAERSSVEFLGEGRPTAAAAVLADRAAPAAGFVAGSLAEEGLPLLVATTRAAAWTSVGSAAPSQAGSLLLTGQGTLIGPELFQAPADVRSGGHERTGVLAANRLILVVMGVLVVASGLALFAGIDLAPSLAGR